MLEVIKRIQELYGDNLRIVSANGDRITIQAKTVLETHFLKDLMDNQNKIFLNDQLNRFQVLCPWDYLSGRGIEIHYLSSPGAYQPGYWWV